MLFQRQRAAAREWGSFGTVAATGVGALYGFDLLRKTLGETAMNGALIVAVLAAGCLIAYTFLRLRASGLRPPTLSELREDSSREPTRSEYGAAHSESEEEGRS